MKQGIKDKTIEEILKTLDRIVDDPQQFEHWTMSIETTAINMNEGFFSVFKYNLKNVKFDQ